MTKKNNVQPQPEMVSETVQPNSVQTDALTVLEAPTSQTDNSVIQANGDRVSIFDAATVRVETKIADKMATMGTIRQRLAHAADLYSEAGYKSGEAKEVAADAAILMYRAQSSGYVSKAEVSAALGDAFGYIPKADGKPGATPAGEGSAIRKRVVRAVAALEYVTNGDGGQFFAGLPEGDVSAIVEGMEEGNLSIWSAYDAFTDLKREHALKTETAFNPATIGKIVERLALPDAVDVFKMSPVLIETYAALQAVLRVIDEVITSDAMGASLSGEVTE